MTGKRRNKGMRNPSFKGYDRIPLDMGEDGVKSALITGRGKQYVFIIVSLLSLCVLTIVMLLLKTSTFDQSDVASSISKIPGYSSSTFNDDDIASQTNTEKNTPKSGYKSNNFKKHQPQVLSSEEQRQITSLTDIDRMYAFELQPLLITRVPDTPGNEAARNHIVSRLNSHDMWSVELDDFRDQTPYGSKRFVNIVATHHPEIKRHLVLACHYDSKYYPSRPDGKEFIGATDSAVPCAMLLDVANNLASLLRNTNQVSTSLQLIFFDGEEAFKTWKSTDSIYGARHLAAKMQDTSHPPGSKKTTQLDAIDLFILLDLMGTRNPVFHNWFSGTRTWFTRFGYTESKLKQEGLIQSRRSAYFDTGTTRTSGIEDDHIPFLRRGVRIIHLIPSPFPSVWHTMDDNADALDLPTIDDLNKILHVFVVEYLHLLDSQITAA